MLQKQHLALTREELYDLVWAKPMTEIAKDHGISDRGMAKLCARKQIPVPPRGYWAKKLANKNVAKPPLPAFAAKPQKEKDVQKNETAQVDRINANNDKRKTKPYSIFEERDNQTKEKLKEYRKTLSDGLYYTVRVKSWNSDYTFGLNSNFNPLRKHDELSFMHEHPFDEHRTLLIKGDILEPSQLKGQKFEAYISPRDYLNKKSMEKNLRHYEENPPKAIGSFQKNRQFIMAFISVPDDAFGLLLQSASADKINFMTFHGAKMRYGQGDVYRFSFREKCDDEDIHD